MVLCDRDSRVLQHTEEPLFAEGSALVADLAERAAPELVVREAGRRLGPLNGRVNSAAWSFQRPVAGLTVAEFDRVAAINQRARLFLPRSFREQLTGEARDPCIANIASVSALVGNSGLVAYDGTKGALLAMTRATAVEFAPSVRVLAIAPSAVWTDYTRGLVRQGVMDPHALAQQHLVPRFITVDEIAEVVAFLFGPAARSVTGANRVFDGGCTAR